MSPSDPSPNGPEKAPGKPAKPRRQRKPKKEAKKKEDAPSPLAQKENRGRIAAMLTAKDVQWLLSPWIPRGMLSLVAGLPAVGKSTFLAWLISRAGRVVVLPGYEEDVEVTTLPRLVANGADLWQIRFLDDKRYTFPRDKKALVNRCKEWGAQLIVFDPIDSYLDDEMNENTGQDVRAFLESIAEVAKETGAAAVGVRHPGKDRINVMPGSRQWRAVPRSIVELVGDGGTPQRLMIRHFKDSLGQDAKPRQYRLEGERGKPRRFILDVEVDATLHDLALVASDPTGKRKIMDAAKLIKHLFEQEEKPAVQDLVAQCRLLGIGEHARDEAKRLLNIISTPLESGGKWVMMRPGKEWPKWLLDADTALPAVSPAETAETGRKR